MNRTTALVATILLALLSLTVGAQVYRWVDKDGKVQYSDQPPPPGAGKSEVTKINSTTPTGGSAPAAPAKAPDKPKGKVEDAAKSKASADDAKVAKENEEYCLTAKSQLRIFEDGGRVKRMNAAGEQEIMSDEQMASEAAKLRRQIAENCK